MIKNIFKFSTVAVILLFSSVNAATNSGGKITVDEANAKTPKPDKVKGGEKLKDKYIEKKISLRNVKKSYVIQRENLLLPPYRCFIYHGENNETQIGIINSSSIQFSIDKSKLKVGDIILVTNKETVESTNSIKKFVVEEIEIIK